MNQQKLTCLMCGSELIPQPETRLNGQVLECSKCSYRAEETDHQELCDTLREHYFNTDINLRDLVRLLNRENSELKAKLDKDNVKLDWKSFVSFHGATPGDNDEIEKLKRDKEELRGIAESSLETIRDVERDLKAQIKLQAETILEQQRILSELHKVLDSHLKKAVVLIPKMEGGSHAPIQDSDEVERLKAVFHAAEGVLSGLEYLPLEHGSLLHRTLKETVYEYRKLMDKRKEGGA